MQAEPLASDRFRDLGVRVDPEGGTLRVASATATTMELCLLSERDPSWVERTVRMQRGDDGIWTGRSALLTPGRRYAVKAGGPDGPRNAFDRSRQLLDPYSRGIVRIDQDSWRSVVVDDAFDWGDVRKPNMPLAETVVYEAHAKGLTKQLPVGAARAPRHVCGRRPRVDDRLPEGPRRHGGRAAAGAPVRERAAADEAGPRELLGLQHRRLLRPHAQYASLTAQSAGPQQVLDEFKGMVKPSTPRASRCGSTSSTTTLRRRARPGPCSFRGIDNSTYYRQDDGRHRHHRLRQQPRLLAGAGRRLIHDSVRYWAEEMQIDGFRFDLAVHARPRREHITYHAGRPRCCQG